MREQEIIHLANLWRVHPNVIRRLSVDKASLLLQLTTQHGVENGIVGVRKDLSPIKRIKNNWKYLIFLKLGCKIRNEGLIKCTRLAKQGVHFSNFSFLSELLLVFCKMAYLKVLKKIALVKLVK